jgi:hypothetical protein
MRNSIRSVKEGKNVGNFSAYSAKIFTTEGTEDTEVNLTKALRGQF